MGNGGLWIGGIGGACSGSVFAWRFCRIAVDAPPLKNPEVFMRKFAVPQAVVDRNAARVCRVVGVLCLIFAPFLGWSAWRHDPVLASDVAAAGAFVFLGAIALWLPRFIPRDPRW